MYEMLYMTWENDSLNLVPYTFRLRFAKTSRVHGISLTNISAAMGLNTEVSHQSFSTFTLSCMSSQHVQIYAKVD